MPGQFVAYYRVSTCRQAGSGLGLDAQRSAVKCHLSGEAGTLLGEYTEIESGKRSDRPQLAAALAACKLHKATLIIAKLDRLARNVAFIAGLMESGVEFVAADNPHASKLMLHMLAAFAEHEREQISLRTKAALNAAKDRGVILGKQGHPSGEEAD
jgi:DNA invertase Pin-like site-specific DNA recombinase